MSDWTDLHPVLLAFLATLFTWSLTALGAAMVFLRKEFSRRALDGMLGFTAGVMIAASYWSLLEPAIEMSRGGSLPAWFPPAAGFLVGALSLLAADKLLPHLHMGYPREKAEGISTLLTRTSLLVLAITLHNIPEGLAVGVAFGSAGLEEGGATFGAALALAIGIGIQNFPEGMAISMPLRREGFPAWKCFWWGQLSAVVEPLAGVLGALVVSTFSVLLPYAFGFAAGAMIFVVVEEVVPESQLQGETDLPTVGVIIGFLVMMILDVALS